MIEGIHIGELWGFGLLCFTSFFSLLNPVGLMPVFISMTAGLDETSRKRTARKSVFVAFITLIIFAFTGQLLFKFFGISVNSFRMAGGVIFFLMGQEMLQAKISQIKLSSQSAKQEYVTDISITPLAIPMLAGPGAITNSIVLMEDANSIELKVVLILTLVLIFGITLAALYLGDKITKWIGDTGVKVMMRLMGLIIMVIAIEFFFSGLGPILRSIFKIG